MRRTVNRLAIFGAAVFLLPTSITFAQLSDEAIDPVVQLVCSALGCGEFSFPATGQTTKYVTSDDGDLKRGAPLSYTLNVDGTITDNNTGLMWEAKTACDGTPSATDLHDGDNQYPWSGVCSGGSQVCGTDADCPSLQTCSVLPDYGTNLTIFKWVAQLNASNYAGHNDWRIPNVKELQSIVNYGKHNPTVASIFNSGASSCTLSAFYLSSTTDDSDPSLMWTVGFNVGSVLPFSNQDSGAVRAVRDAL